MEAAENATSQSGINVLTAEELAAQAEAFAAGALSFPENYDEDDGATAEDAEKELYDAMVESAQKLSMR